MRKRILIVEDHADIRKLIHMTLEFEDYDIHEAANADDLIDPDRHGPIARADLGDKADP